MSDLPANALVVRGGQLSIESLYEAALDAVSYGYLGFSVWVGDLNLDELVLAARKDRPGVIPHPVVATSSVGRLAGYDLTQSGSVHHYTLKLDTLSDHVLTHLVGCFDLGVKNPHPMGKK